MTQIEDKADSVRQVNDIDEDIIVNGSIYSIMKEMEVDTKLIVHEDAWNAVRPYSHLLKKKYGMWFSVNKMFTNRTKNGYLLIRRLK